MKSIFKLFVLFSLHIVMSLPTWADDGGTHGGGESAAGEGSGESASGGGGAQPWEQMCAELAKEQMKNDPSSVQKLFQALTQMFQGGEGAADAGAAQGAGASGGASSGGASNLGEVSSSAGTNPVSTRSRGGCPNGRCGR